MRPTRLRLCSCLFVVGVGVLWLPAGFSAGSTEPVYCPVIEECVSDYLAFPLVAPDPPAPLPAGESQRLLDRMDHEKEPLLEQQPAPETLRSMILDGLNVRKLLSGPGRALPTFRVTPAQVRGQRREAEVFISDPYVGEIRGFLAQPKEGPPGPAVLAIHGHTDTPEVLFERLEIDALVDAGFVVLLLDQRGAGADFWEDFASRQLLEAGHSLLGLRVYESLLGLRVLQSLEGVRPDRVGLLGHSGGSVVSNLTIWLDEGFAAYASDHSSIYFNIVEGWLGDETSPAIHRIHPHVNRLEAAPIPTLRAPYDYPLGMNEVIPFFRNHLGAAEK